MVTDRWNDAEASAFTSLLDQRVYSSRLLGGDPELVMHGGGNTSVKDKVISLFGEPEDVLYIKGSGCDLATIERPGFPAVRLATLMKLRGLKQLSDPDMVNYLRTHLFTSPAPDPSVEALLHAFLPFPFVDHTHADAVLTLTNQPNGESLVRELYEGRVGIVPYIMPGFYLAQKCLDVFDQNPKVEGLILLKHGILTWGQTAKEAYQRMIRLVQQAEKFIESRPPKPMPSPSVERRLNAHTQSLWMQSIRSEYLHRGYRPILLLDNSPTALNFTDRADLKTLSERGPVTPDHVIRTKRLPLPVPRSAVQADEAPALAPLFEKYAEEYRSYFAGEQKKREAKLVILDPLPRVLLVPGVGIVTAGKTLKEARIAMDIYQHTVQVIEHAEKIGTYDALSASDIFDVEYWVLEQAKLSLAPKGLPLTGKTAVITGGASGIGLAIAKEYLDKGAVVHVLDINEARFIEVKTKLKAHTKSGNGVSFHKVDLSKRAEVHQSLEAVVRENGGIDILVANAGIFPASHLLENIPLEDWQKSIDVNLNGTFHVVAETMQWMKSQKTGGDIVFIASKNVSAPGPEAGAYSIPKAAQVQLARVCALEGGKHGIRVNILHPHLIFDTGIWSEEIIEKRAKAYKLTPEEYKKNNLLITELTSSDVAQAAFALVSGMFAKTTGAQIPVDGGSDRTL